MLIVERDGGFRRVLADDGHTIGVYGVFFGAKKDKQLEGIISADVSKGREVLAITGSLQGIPYEIDLRKLEETQPSLSYVVLSDWLTRLNLDPGTSFVATERLGIKVSAAASKPLLNSAGGNVKELRYCDAGSTLIGVTDDGKLIGWKQKERQIDTKSAYERLAFRDGKGAFFVPRLACNDQFLMSTGPGGKYGNVQLWDTNEGVLVKHFANPQILFGKEIALARSGSFAATLTSSGTIVWQLGGGDMKRIGSVTLSTKKSGTQKHQQVQGVSISDDGSTLALTDGETVFLLDLPSLTGERRFGSSVVVKEIKIER